jgi:hypothetical protein
MGELGVLVFVVFLGGVIAVVANVVIWQRQKGVEEGREQARREQERKGDARG